MKPCCLVLVLAASTFVSSTGFARAQRPPKPTDSAEHLRETEQIEEGEETTSTGARIAYEAVGGVLGLTAGFTLGLGVTAAAMQLCDGDYGCGRDVLIYGVYAALGTTLVTAPLGVYLTGDAHDGNGSYLATFLGNLGGSAIGFGAGYLLLTLATLGGNDSSLVLGSGIASLLLGPILGSILGYELSNNADSEDHVARPILVPSVAAVGTHGFQGGLAGVF